MRTRLGMDDYRLILDAFMRDYRDMDPMHRIIFKDWIKICSKLAERAGVILNEEEIRELVRNK